MSVGREEKESVQGSSVGKRSNAIGRSIRNRLRARFLLRFRSRAIPIRGMNRHKTNERYERRFMLRNNTFPLRRRQVSFPMLPSGRNFTSQLPSTIKKQTSGESRTFHDDGNSRHFYRLQGPFLIIVQDCEPQCYSRVTRHDGTCNFDTLPQRFPDFYSHVTFVRFSFSSVLNHRGGFRLFYFEQRESNERQESSLESGEIKYHFA